MKNLFYVFIATAAAATLYCAQAAIAGATPSTAFTYQGQIDDAGTPVSDPIDVRFRLWSAPAGGVQVADPIEVGLTPSAGRFTQSLDFGAEPFETGSPRWLEVEVSLNGGVDWTSLGRNMLAATPFALATRGIAVNESGHVGLSTDSPQRNLQIGNFGADDTYLRMATSGGNRFKTGLELRHFTEGFGWDILSDETRPALLVRSVLDGMADTRIRFTYPDGRISINAETGASARVRIVEDENDCSSLLIEHTGARGDGLRILHTGTDIAIGAYAEVISGYGVYGKSNAVSGAHYGVYGQTASPNGWGVFSNGRIGATGTKSFMIDHPLDPANKVLLHYSTEAPEPLNTYSGVAHLDETGRAVVALPDYFEAINTNIRYQLTAVGAPAPSLHVAQRVQNGRFIIAGGPAGLEVSWEITARRNDAFVRQRGAPVELEKQGHDRGRYLTPELYGMPARMGVHHDETVSHDSDAR